MRYRLFIGMILFCAVVLPANAQQNATTDSLKRDSLRRDSIQVAEIYLLQLQEQHLLDSLIKIGLQKELKTVTGDAKKTQGLEAKLKKIETTDSLRKIEEVRRIDELRKISTGWPVAPFGDTLFYVYAWVGPFKPEDRAAGITQRIKQLYEDDFLDLNSFKIIKSENSHDIFYKNNFPVTSVTNIDALWLNTTNEQLAKVYLAKIKTAIQQERDDNSLTSWLKKIGSVLLIILAVAVVIFFINKLFRALGTFLLVKTGITIANIKLLSDLQYKEFLSQVLKTFRIVIILLAVYLSLPLLFTVFPETKNLTNTLLGWVIDPAKLILKDLLGFLPNLFTIVIVYFLARYVIKAIRYFANEVHAGNIRITGFHEDFAKPTFNIIRFLLYAFMLVIIFPYLPGSGSPAFRGVSVFLGLLLSLGSSSAINNIIAGLVITYMRPFKIGDRIQIGDVVGDVIEKTMLVIRIRTIKNEDITVPNSTLLSSTTTNFSAHVKEQGLIIHTTVTIGYDVPWKEMHKTLIAAAIRTEAVLKEPPPFVLQTSLDDFFVSYQLNAYIKDANNQHIVYSELHQNIQDCCNDAGIEIMSPHYTSLRDGNTTTIPGNYHRKDYKPRAFNVKQVKSENEQSNISAESKEPKEDESIHTSVIGTQQKM